MSSGRLADYLGKGAAAERPVTLDLHPEAVGFYYATDTETWSAWDGTGWVPVVAGGVPAADEVTYDNAASGLSAVDVQEAIDELAQAAGGIADAPSDGKLYGRKDAAWEEVEESGGGIQSVVPGDGISVDDTDPANPVISATGSGSDVVDVATPTISSGTVTLDFSGKSSYVAAVTLTSNVTALAFDNLPGAGRFAEYELHITQDATGGRTFAIPASHRALGGSDTAVATAANAVTVLSASTVDNGATWRYAMQESA